MAAPFIESIRTREDDYNLMTDSRQEEALETTEIGSRSDFALWAIQRAQEIVTSEGAAFAIAARDMNEDALAATASALGTAISEAMLEVFDGLIGA